MDILHRVKHLTGITRAKKKTLAFSQVISLVTAMRLPAVNFTNKTLHYRGHWSDAAGDSLMVVILPGTLEGASRRSRSSKRRPI